LPNRAPDNPTGANNFSANYQQILTRNNYTAKVDHNFTERDRFNFRYLYNSDDRNFTTVFPNIVAETNTPALRHQNYFYLGYTRTFSPAVINEFRYTYSNRINHETSFGLGESWPSRLGLKGAPDGAFPQINVAGVTTLGAGTHERRQLPLQHHQFVNNPTVTPGRHPPEMGAELRETLNFQVNPPPHAGQVSLTPLLTRQAGKHA